jgi:hypothetical protein
MTATVAIAIVTIDVGHWTTLACSLTCGLSASVRVGRR